MTWTGQGAVPARVELGAGTVLDRRFRVRSVLGQGGLSCVYLADDLRRGHDVALKTLIPSYRGRAEREQRLLDEAVCARQIGAHPVLPGFYGAGRLRDLGDSPYLAWEVVKGCELGVVLVTRSQIRPRIAAEWTRQLASALCTMHHAGVVHRDVTTSNVLIEEPNGEARARLIDLSHAARISVSPASPRHLTRALELPGRHRVMPPEQARARPAHPKMDVFSLGVVLYEMLTGRSPFEYVRGPALYLELLRTGQLRVPRIDRRAYPEIPAPMVELVAACTHQDMNARLEMAQIMAWIDHDLAGVPVVFRSGGASESRARCRPPGAGLDAPGLGEEPPGSPALIDADGFRGAATLARVEREPAAVRARTGPSPRPWVVGAVVAMVMLVLASAAAGLAWPRPVVPSARVLLRGITGPAPDRRAAEPVPIVGRGGLSPRALEPADTSAPVEATSPQAPRPRASASPPRRRRARRKRPARARGPQTDACRSLVATALVAHRGQVWSRLEILTRRSECFADRSQWARLRAQALLETERFAQCAALAERFKQPDVQKYARICRAREDSR